MARCWNREVSARFRVASRNCWRREVLPQRSKTYVLLFFAMSISVFANILFFQAPGRPRTTAAAHDPKAMRVGNDAARSAGQVNDTVRTIQRELKEMNLYPGQVDGRLSLVVNAAIMAYEQGQALPITGEPTQALVRELIVGPSLDAGKVPAGGNGVIAGTAAEAVLRDLRQKLAALGYTVGNVDGRMTLELIQGIRAFERDNGMPPSGRVGAQLMLQLQRSAVAFKLKTN